MGTHTESHALMKPLYSNGKRLAQSIFVETLAALDIREVMLSKIKCEGNVLTAGDIALPFSRPPRVVALGKAANRMAAALEDILGGRIGSGVAVLPAKPAHTLDRFRFFVGGHPYPNQESLDGAQAALDLVSNLSPDDLVIFLVSGGGSAIFEQPLDPEISLADLVEFNRILVTSDLPIEKINVLRKHLSAVKGGRLAMRAHPARQLTLYVSDVPEGHQSMVASGPTMPDEATAENAYAIAEAKGLTAKFPAKIRIAFEKHALAETPKPDDERFLQCRYFCLLSNRDAVQSAKASAEKAGFVCKVDRTEWDADYRQVANSTLASLDAFAAEHSGQPACLVAGGEVTCEVTGPGTGGRNQAFALYAAQQIAGQRRVVLSAATDGRDGNSPACGAVADGQTISRGLGHGLDASSYLADSDSYHFFRTLGDTIETGYTENNVRDVRLLMDFA